MRSSDKPPLDLPEKTKPPRVILPKKGSVVRTRQHKEIEPSCLLGAAKPDRIKWIDHYGWFMGENCNHASSSHSWTYGSYEVLEEPK